jgi:formylglycine-generating enzyme required for sulfatase activity
VVEEPAKRYGVQVDTDLIDALCEDAPKEDALPLLAFALQRLWHQYAESGVLTKGNYEKFGRLKGLIEDAAERALRGMEPNDDEPLPSSEPSKRLVELGASTFVPTLTQINETGATIRRIAEWRSFSDEQQELLLRFDRWRLVVRKGEEDGGTIEAANEALFREWRRLKSWLEPDRSRLAALRSLQIDAATWNHHGRDRAFLNHRGKRLLEVNGLVGVEGYRKLLRPVEVDYLAACQEAERLARRRSHLVEALIAVLALFLIAGLIGWMNQAYLFQRWRLMTSIEPYIKSEVRPFVLTTEAERVQKDPFRECRKDCPEMVVIPARNFRMGSAVSEKGRQNDEGPQHNVVIAQPFAISKFEVTFDDWGACVSYGNCRAVDDMNWEPSGQRPVINITWQDAKQYVEWLAGVTGKPYRLPSEAEWEYAARAGSQTAYSWGDDIGEGNANCSGCSSGPRPDRTQPVNSFAANAFGLYNVHGNVWEWVEDCYHSDYAGAPSNGSAWTSGDCEQRVARGGGWWSVPPDVRSARRLSLSFRDPGTNLGFRIARTLTP